MQEPALPSSSVARLALGLGALLTLAACGRPPLPEPRYAAGGSRGSITVTSPA